MPTRMADFVRYMFDAQEGYERRDAFFGNPHQAFADFAKARGGDGLTPEEQAVIFAMERTFVVDQIWQREQQDVADPVLSWDFDNGAGKTWEPGDVEEDPYASNVGGGQPLRAAMAAAGGGGWTAPNPEIWDVRPFDGEKDKGSAEVVVVAEGILPGAELILSSVLGHRPGVMLRAPLQHFEVKNFRRIYAKATIPLANAERTDYDVFVRNHRDCPYVPWTVGVFTVK